MRNEHDVFNALFSELSASDIKSVKLKSELSKAIRARRIELNMSQAEFATHMGISQAMVSKWESHSYNFSVESIAEIFTKLDMDVHFEFESDAHTYQSTRHDFCPYLVDRTQKVTEEIGIVEAA